MCNKDIRDYARIKDVRMWQIASRLGINDSTLCRKLRSELPEENKSRIIAIIDELAAE